MKSFLFFDTETGGLDPRTDALTQVGITYGVIMGGKLHTAPATDRLWNVKPFDGGRISLRAANIQGAVDPQTIFDDPDRTPEARLIAEIEDYLQLFDESIPVYAWNAPFDTSFIFEMAKRYGERVSRLGKLHGRVVRDARALGLICYDLGLIRPGSGGFSLKIAAETFGLTQPEPHNALADAQVGAEVLTRLLQLVTGEGVAGGR